MKTMFNEEKHKEVMEFLNTKNADKPTKKMTREEMLQAVNKNGLNSVRRIDFNNNNITDNVAFINTRKDKHHLIITNEKGMVVTELVFDDVEEAYYALVNQLNGIKKFLNY